MTEVRLGCRCFLQPASKQRIGPRDLVLSTVMSVFPPLAFTPDSSCSGSGHGRSIGSHLWDDGARWRDSPANNEGKVCLLFASLKAYTGLRR